MTIKILTIVGARPQFIKAAVVSRLLRADSRFQEVLVHTGQHYDSNMSDVFFDELEMPKPEYHLGIGSGHHGKQTGEMLAAIEEVLLKEQPAWVLIYGDTNSTLAGALAASKLHVPVAHVEAGLRSFNRKMPEEINRIVADQLSQLLLVPTQQGMSNLEKEGVAQELIHWVGDVMYDAALYYGKKADEQSQILSKLGLSPKKYILATVHRAENTDDEQRLKAIFSAFNLLAQEMSVVLPLHPRTRKMLEQYNLLQNIPSRLHLIEPIGFLDMVMLEKNASLVVTDSGGVQKEAFFYEVPCITLRDETEWVELVELGWNQIVPPTSAEKIYRTAKQAIDKVGDRRAKPYGHGNAGELIVGLLQ